MAAQKLAKDQAKEPGELDRNLHSETNNSGWEMGEGKKISWFRLQSTEWRG